MKDVKIEILALAVSDYFISSDVQCVLIIVPHRTVNLLHRKPTSKRICRDTMKGDVVKYTLCVYLQVKQVYIL
jgi:hypothetical protein